MERRICESAKLHCTAIRLLRLDYRIDMPQSTVGALETPMAMKTIDLLRFELMRLGGGFNRLIALEIDCGIVPLIQNFYRAQNPGFKVSVNWLDNAAEICLDYRDIVQGEPTWPETVVQK